MGVFGELASLFVRPEKDAGFEDTFASRFGAAPLDPAEAAALRQRQFTNRQQGEGAPRAERVMGGLADLSRAIAAPATGLVDYSRARVAPAGPMTEEEAFRINQTQDAPGKAVLEAAKMSLPVRNPLGAVSQAEIRGGTLYAGGQRDPRLWSPISKTKLSKPLSEMEHGYTDVRVPVPKFVEPEALVGSYGIFTPWDLSAANKTLTHVDAQKLAKPVRLHGGAGFPEANPGMAAASETAISRRLDNQAADLTNRTGKPVTIWPIAMSPQGIDASHHVADPLSQLLQGAKITNKDVKAFDTLMRESVPDWVSIKNPKFPEYLNTLQGGMTTKALLANRGALAEWQAKGFPDVAAIRHAASEPALIDVPRNTTGMAISQYTPGQGLLQTTHPSYPKGVAGQHMGQLASLVPFEVAAPSIAEALAKYNAANKALGKKVASTPAYHFQKPHAGVPVEQYFDKAWAEGIRRHWGDVK
jgi:hypothetical protein